MGKATQWTIVMALCLGACGACGPRERQLSQRLTDDNPDVRRQAVVEAGQTLDEQAVPRLVDCLEDPEIDVRFFAILALERITGETMGYKYYDNPCSRRQAVTRWRQWLESRPAPDRPGTQVAAKDGQ